MRLAHSNLKKHGEARTPWTARSNSSSMVRLAHHGQHAHGDMRLEKKAACHVPNFSNVGRQNMSVSHAQSQSFQQQFSA